MFFVRRIKSQKRPERRYIVYQTVVAVAYGQSVKLRFNKRMRCNGKTGRVTMTTESSKNGETTLSRMNFSGYVGHVTIFS